MENAIQKAEKLAVEPYEFNTSQYYSRGWEIFKSNPGLFISFSVVSTIIVVIAYFIPFASLAVNAPLLAGYYIVARKIDREEAIEFGDFFKGFNHFVQLLLLGLVTGILVAVGFVFLIIPGIYLAIGYMMANQLVIFGKMEFWDAMEASRKVIHSNWGSAFGFALLTILIMFGGLLLFGIGIFVAWPWITCATYAAFADIFKINEDDIENDILDHLVMD